MTPLELAQLLGYKHMFDILRPVICHSIPYDVLVSVQEHFHFLIRSQLGEETVRKQHIRLPLLEPLTEASDGIMWFPLREHFFSNAVSYSR